MLPKKLKPNTIQISELIAQAFRSGRQKYEVHLVEEKKKMQKAETEVRAMQSYSETKKKVVEMMEKEVIECMEKAEQNNDTSMSYVTIDLEAIKKKLC